MGLFGFLKKKGEPSLPVDAAAPVTPLPSFADAPPGTEGLPPIGDVSAQQPLADLPPLGTPPPAEAVALDELPPLGAPPPAEFQLPDFSEDDVRQAKDLNTPLPELEPEPEPVEEESAPMPGPLEREEVVQPPVQEPVQSLVEDSPVPFEMPQPAAPVEEDPQGKAPVVDEQPVEQPPTEAPPAPVEESPLAQEPVQELSQEPSEPTPAQPEWHREVEGELFIEKREYMRLLLGVTAIESRVKQSAANVEKVISDEVVITDKLKAWHDLLSGLQEKLMAIDDRLFEKGET